MALKSARNLVQSCWRFFKPQSPYEWFAKLYKKMLQPRVDEAINSGKRICHFIILAEEEEVCWDEHFPPKLKCEGTKVLRDNEIYKFFQDEKNFVFAKKYLMQQKFEKIDCGYEAFPLDMRQTSLGSAPTVYHYVRRPFIHLSTVEEGPGARQMLLNDIGPAFISD